MGRIMWQKNLELAIDAYRVATGRGLRARLVVAGAVDAKSAAYLDALRARSRGLEVSFEIGPGDDRVSWLYRSCLAVVVPALNEDFGIVPLEAMASGAPVLAVDGGGLRETVVHGRTGWLLDPEPEALARAMLEAAAEPARLEPMRAQARERAAAFSWERFAARIDDVMEQIASERRT